MSTDMTVTITEGMLPYVREYLAGRVGGLASDYQVVLDGYADPRQPFRRAGRGSSAEQVAEARDALREGERMLDELGLEGDGGGVLHAPADVLAKMAENLVEGGAGMVASANLYEGMTRNDTDAWYAAELAAGIELRVLLAGQAQVNA